MDEHVGLYLKKISEAIDKYMDAQLREYGLTNTQARVLGYLNRNCTRVVTQKDLEEFLGVSHATVSGIIQRLWKNGFIEVTVDDKDKRAKNVKTTRKENAIFEKMHDNREKNEARIVRGLSAEQQKELLAYLKLVYANVTE